MTDENNTMTLSALSREKLLEKLLYYKDQYEHECEEFEEYKQSSQEMEQMMENEIEGLKKELRETQREKGRLETELDRSMTRHEHEKREQLKIEETLRKECNELRIERDRLRIRVRDLEQKNDDLERSERNNQQLLEDLEKKLNETVERTAILESELLEKQLNSEEVYRLKEELRCAAPRPRMAVEPLRIERVSGSSDNEMDAENAEEFRKSSRQRGCMKSSEIIPLNVSTPLQTPPPSSTQSTRFPFGVSRIINDLLTKVDRLEGMLTSIKPSQHH